MPTADSIIPDSTGGTSGDSPATAAPGNNETTGTASTTEPAEPAADETSSNGDEDVSGLKSALASEREKRRAAERAAKKTQTELARLQEAALSESEQQLARARREADQQARDEVRRELGSRLVKAELRAEAAGQVRDLDSIVEDLDLTRLLTEDGEPNTRAIKALVTRLSKATTTSEPNSSSNAVPPFPSGVRGPASTPDMNALIRHQANK